MKNHRVLLLLFIVIVYISGYVLLDRWKTTLYFGDSNGYYLHLVSFFINGDTGDYDTSISTLLETSPKTQDPREDPYGIRLTPKGKRYIKYTLGVPVMEAPFFLIAHAYSLCSKTFPANGWSKPYLLVTGLSAIFYVLTGFFLLISILERFFSKRVTALVVLTIALATNLFFQSTYVTMAHGFLFFDYCLLLFFTIAFYEKPTWIKSLAIGGTVGLITLTRVPELISALIPLLWGITTWSQFKNRIHFFAKQYLLLLPAIIGFLLVFSVQFLYWQYVSGKLVFNPYQGEGFNFLQPNIWKGWFHFRNGWLIYTPVMAFSMIGLFMLARYTKAIVLPLLLFVGLHVYIHYSYYAWSYFPGLGSRPMVETYPLLAFGLAACYTELLKRRFLAWLPFFAFLFFTGLNLFQTWQMREGIIWSERGNPGFYYETLGLVKPTKRSLVAYDTQEVQIDSAELTFIDTLYSENFEATNHQMAVVTNIKHSGNYAYLTRNEEISYFPLFQLGEDIRSGDWIELKVGTYMHPSDQFWQRDRCLRFGIQFLDKKGKVRKEKTLKISSHIGNDNYSIWTAGKAGIWDTVTFRVKVPNRVNKYWKGRLLIKNQHGQKLYLDDILVSNLRVKTYSD